LFFSSFLSFLHSFIFSIQLLSLLLTLTAPADAVPRALAQAGATLEDVDFHEINEAFSAVALVNARLLNLDLAALNVHGGAVALGHPLGASGSKKKHSVF
jgi:acetyl-CoA acetyltransferase